MEFYELESEYLNKSMELEEEKFYICGFMLYYLFVLNNWFEKDNDINKAMLEINNYCMKYIDIINMEEEIVEKILKYLSYIKNTKKEFDFDESAERPLFIGVLDLLDDAFLVRNAKYNYYFSLYYRIICENNISHGNYKIFDNADYLTEDKYQSLLKVIPKK